MTSKKKSTYFLEIRNLNKKFDDFAGGDTNEEDLKNILGLQS